MKALSQVVSAVLLLGVVLAGFTLAYPLLFKRGESMALGLQGMLESRAKRESIDLQLVDYYVVKSTGGLNLTLIVFNAGRITAHVERVVASGIDAAVSVDIPPREARCISVSPVASIPSRVILVLREAGLVELALKP